LALILNWNRYISGGYYLNNIEVICKQNLHLKLEHLEHLEQTGTEIGTVITDKAIKNAECSNVPILLLKSSMGEEKKKVGKDNRVYI